MRHKQKAVQRLYSRLLKLYPRAFRERFGESMQQTFNDLYNERKQRTGWGVWGFVIWVFLDTSGAIARERFQLVMAGGNMRITLKNLVSFALASFLLNLPLMIMEVVNRRHLNEVFPFVLFLGFWLVPFTISLFLLPIVQAWRARKHDLPNSVLPQSNSLLTNPRLSATISIALLLLFLMRFVLIALGWESLERLLNGPNPELPYLPGQIVAFLLGFLPVAAGIIAGRPIVNTLRTGGSLVAHPLHLIIIVALSLLFSAGFIFLLIDQWPCFIGVPNCD